MSAVLANREIKPRRQDWLAEGPGFEPGLTDRDSGVELSPTGTDRRGGPRTASNRTVRASSAIAAGSTRWLMRRTKRPLSASLEEWPVLAATPIYKDPHPRVEPPNSTNQSSGDPSRQPMQTDDGKAHCPRMAKVMVTRKVARIGCFLGVLSDLSQQCVFGLISAKSLRPNSLPASRHHE
jgi:hypothetical protein